MRYKPIRLLVLAALLAISVLGSTVTAEAASIGQADLTVTKVSGTYLELVEVAVFIPTGYNPNPNDYWVGARIRGDDGGFNGRDDHLGWLTSSFHARSTQVGYVGPNYQYGVKVVLSGMLNVNEDKGWFSWLNDRDEVYASVTVYDFSTYSWSVARTNTVYGKF